MPSLLCVLDKYNNHVHIRVVIVCHIMHLLKLGLMPVLELCNDTRLVNQAKMNRIWNRIWNMVHMNITCY